MLSVVEFLGNTGAAQLCVFVMYKGKVKKQTFIVMVTKQCRTSWDPADVS